MTNPIKDAEASLIIRKEFFLGHSVFKVFDRFLAAMKSWENMFVLRRCKEWYYIFMSSEALHVLELEKLHSL